ncbi:hypothetical protein PoB_001683600 [Plakobranchus ocellatus]|uniref:Uncharacterized protein n=1 Tax=Plakobranchus ocellatus TaxID=259542 RepID=A0AAV3Z371_9GAST|nr:hypothetical protein PoB_001683600 [Plakobranchus ocellatus]
MWTQIKGPQIVTFPLVLYLCDREEIALCLANTPLNSAGTFCREFQIAPSALGHCPLTWLGRIRARKLDITNVMKGLNLILANFRLFSFISFEILKNDGYD